MHRSRKPEYSQGYRGFESPPLRQSTPASRDFLAWGRKGAAFPPFGRQERTRESFDGPILTRAVAFLSAGDFVVRFSGSERFQQGPTCQPVSSEPELRLLGYLLDRDVGTGQALGGKFNRLLAGNNGLDDFRRAKPETRQPANLAWIDALSGCKCSERTAAA